jgi:Spy/CpxP family protein refolding chaperone
MLGFIVGTVSLYGLYKMSRRGAPLSLLGGSPQMLQRVLRRLDTTPAQERVIVEAIDEARQSAQGLRKEATMSKEDVITMLKSEEVEVDALGAAFARQDEALTDARLGATAALQKIHNALTEEQRLKLGRMLKGSWY